MSFMEDKETQIKAWIQGKPEIVVTLEQLNWIAENRGSLVLTFRQDGSSWNLCTRPVFIRSTDQWSLGCLLTSLPLI